MFEVILTCDFCGCECHYGKYSSATILEPKLDHWILCENCTQKILDLKLGIKKENEESSELCDICGKRLLKNEKRHETSTDNGGHYVIRCEQCHKEWFEKFVEERTKDKWK